MDNPSKVKTIWFQDLPAGERDNFKQSVLGSQLVLDKLSKIVYNMVVNGEKVKLTDYDSPSWSHKQADQNGYNRALRDILEIIKINGDH